jgi:hypothetical protein
VAALVAAAAARLQLDHPVRVAVDAPPWSGLELAPRVLDALGPWSRPGLLVRCTSFLRPASLRLERGRDDADAFYEDWLDRGALAREVLTPAGPGGWLQVLPARWDATRERSTRASYVVLPASAVVVVDGWFLLDGSLPFDLTVHVALSPAARRRRVPPGDAMRELPAWDRYDSEVAPATVADVVVRADDPQRPAVVER